jgi:hypothetical protein
MRLESARGLKQELLEEVIAPFTARTNLVRDAGIRALVRAMAAEGHEADAARFAIGAQRLGAVPQIQRTMALGVATRGRQYRLAVRLQRAALSESPLMEQVVKKARGEVDVRLVGRIDKRQRAIEVPWYQQNQRPLLIGSSIGHQAVTAGTLGAFVMRGRQRCVLSNNHVLADEGRATKGDRVLQRARFDGGTTRAESVARAAYWVTLRDRGANLVDAALATIDAGVASDPALLKSLVNGRDRRLAGVGPDFVDVGTVVYKIGRTTGPTKGRVTAFDLDNVVVNFDVGNLRFDNQIEIEGSATAAFSDGGDSGSLIVVGAGGRSSEMLAVALLFAGSESGGTNGRGLTYANPIHEVLDRLNARLLPE